MYGEESREKSVKDPGNIIKTQNTAITMFKIDKYYWAVTGRWPWFDVQLYANANC